MIGAGQLNERITVYSNSTEANEYNETVDSKAMVFETWARVTFISDGEKFRAGAVDHNISVRFVIRRRTIDMNQEIKYDGIFYAIVGAKPVGKSKEFLEITGARI